ncbi:hypothetical protein MASR1M45_02030 [Candidatus Kapaibacterium sp.]
MVFSQYDKEILTIEIIEKVTKELIQKGLYQPTRVSQEVKNNWKQDIELSDLETEQVFLSNPQSHKEAGFDKGWASRFDTWFKIAKELGFVYYWQDEKIEFSESSKMLLEKEKPENEPMVFANAFAKYSRNNPFRRVLNNNTPLVLLLQVIQLLNNDKNFNGTGISRIEIPILLCWQNNNANLLYKKIIKLRKDFGYSPSSETILDICYSLIDDTKRDDTSILVDYPDDFIRKMRLTGLITLRGAGRFIDINTKEIEAVNYILQTYSIDKLFETEREFYNYISIVDFDLISKLSVYVAPARTSNKELEKWIEYYQWERIKAEMLNLSQNKSSKDDILKIIERPLRLEFLTSLAIQCKLPKVTIKPNFLSDDEGLPISFASGGNPDIECYENREIALVEVTLLTGTQQHIRESYSVQRHLEEFKAKNENSYSIFISPKCFIDTCRNAAFIKFQYDLDVKILDIDLFLNQLENHRSLRNVAFTNTSCK